MKKVYIVLMLLLVLGGCGVSNSLSTKKIVMNGQSVIVELAQTPEARKQGLSGRQNLCETCGMLFIFPENNRYTFWMKEMNFPLDIIWLKDGVVENSSLSSKT